MISGMCWCDRFWVPSCCGRYLEDIEGYLVHTTTICYDSRTRLPLSLPIAPGAARPCPLDVASDPDLFDYSNEGDALIIEEVENVK